MGHQVRGLGLTVLSVCSLAQVGCSQSMQAGLHTLSQALPSPVAPPDLQQQPLNPQLHYLRVQVDTARGPQVALAVEGDRDTLADGQAISVWYGADGTVLRLHQGRLVGFATATQSWRIVNAQAWPGWPATGTAVATSATTPPAATFWQRTASQPGHRWGAQQVHQQSWVDTPPRGHAFQGSLTGLRWVVARPVSTQSTATLAWYAVDDSQPTAPAIYGRQCLDGFAPAAEPPVCVHWQHWPPR